MIKQTKAQQQKQEGKDNNLFDQWRKERRITTPIVEKKEKFLGFIF